MVAMTIVLVGVMGSPALAADAPACTAAALRLISRDRNAATGHLILYFRLRNVSRRPCAMFGFPGVRFVDHGRVVPIPVVWATADFFGATRTRRVTIRPGRVASFRVVVVTSEPYSCDRTASAIQVYAANTTRALHVRLADRVPACNATVIPVQPGVSYGHPG